MMLRPAGRCRVALAVECCSLAAAADAELSQQAVDVVLDGRHLDPEVLRDRLVGLAPLDQAQDLALATGQAGAVGFLAVDGEAADVGEQRLRDPGRAAQAAVDRRVDRLGEVAHRRVLHEIAGGAGLGASDDRGCGGPRARLYDGVQIPLRRRCGSG